MLTKFRVTNFKGFKEEIVLDLSNTGNYEFNIEAVKNNVVNFGMIYGFNGCGKSNLGLALFDIVSHLTDKNCKTYHYEPYLNLDAPKKQAAVFQYEFLFKGMPVVYRYEKLGFGELLSEELTIDGEKVIHYDFASHTGEISLAGAETLKPADSENPISRVKYTYSNSILDKSLINEAFISFMSFVERMLYFYSLDRNTYIGFDSGSESATNEIIKAGKTKSFEAFLKLHNINMSLTAKESEGKTKLMAHYRNANIPFGRVASKGTLALTIFYYWYITMEKASFVYMDEFDAFYHFELSENIVKEVKKLDGPQVIFTTHNTDLLSNDILRPDCYFWMDEGKITNLSMLTEKELRKAHNLQKMFKAGAFIG